MFPSQSLLQTEESLLIKQMLAHNLAHVAYQARNSRKILVKLQGAQGNSSNIQVHFEGALLEGAFWALPRKAGGIFNGIGGDRRLDAHKKTNGIMQQ